MEDFNNFEQNSYCRYAYKRVNRLRRKGKRRGIEVPYLDHDLTKPEKPRLIFLIATVVSAIILVAILVGIGFLFNELVKLIPDFNGMGDVLKVLFDPDVFMASAGLTAIPAMLIFLAVLLLLVMFFIPIGAAIYMYRFVRDVYYMSKCSKEEFAKGGIVSSRIFGLTAALVLATVILVVILSSTDASNAKLYAWLVYGGIAIALGGLLALMMVEKVRCGKWFETLEEEHKQNYLDHERALRRVKSRLNTEKRIWNDLGK